MFRLAFFLARGVNFCGDVKGRFFLYMSRLSSVLACVSLSGVLGRGEIRDVLTDWRDDRGVDVLTGTSFSLRSSSSPSSESATHVT